MEYKFAHYYISKFYASGELQNPLPKVCFMFQVQVLFNFGVWFISTLL